METTQTEPVGNAVMVAVGCSLCPSNTLTMLPLPELEAAHAEVGKRRVCANCKTAWDLEQLRVRYSVTPGKPTVALVIPLWRPFIKKDTPMRVLDPVADSFSDYDQETIAQGVEEMAASLAKQ